MVDYGLRISVNGKDAKTCSDLDTVVNSKYSNLKGNLSGSGSISNDGDSIVTATIIHNLGYVPFCQTFVNYSGETFWRETPSMDSGFGIWKYSYIKFDGTNLYIVTDFGGESATTVYYKYFIFIDKGKL